MSFPEGMPLKERRVLAAIAALLVVAVGVTAGLVTTLLVSGGGDEAGAQTIREYNIEVVPADIDYGGGNVWHAWTYKLAGEPAGTVPGPTLTAKVGERLVVHVKNNLDIVHSFHTHFTNYDIESDGSQANVISGKGAGAMIPPGGEWTYEFDMTEPGIFYYHCHSADGGRHITEHIHQGLYGAIIVKAPDEPAVLGVALNEVFVPLLQKQFPEITDFYLPPEGCSYRVACVSIKKQYPGHAKRVMFGVWSFLRQFMYTKFVIVTDDDVSVRDWQDVIWAISTRMDPARDCTIIENTPIDYLDFASPVSGLGSKIGFDATNKWPGETSREWGRPVAMSPEVKARVDALWVDLGIG